jgi:uncharacterized membrane protein
MRYVYMPLAFIVLALIGALYSLTGDWRVGVIIAAVIIQAAVIVLVSVERAMLIKEKNKLSSSLIRLVQRQKE